jgi:hypothetical protein
MNLFRFFYMLFSIFVLSIDKCKKTTSLGKPKSRLVSFGWTLQGVAQTPNMTN